jgi:pyruvate dehydrogenase E2 component (dihydrolipoamide acetyltransferase)
MPSLGADMEAGTLVEWLKHPGDAVTRGDIIAVVDTQKGAIEIEVFDDGVIAETLVPVGQKVPVGTVLARIGGTGATAAPAAPPPRAIPAAPSPPVTVAATAASATPAPSPQPAARLRASPAARTLAEDLRVDLGTIAGTGPEGAITRADVERAAKAPAVSVAAGDRATDMRLAIAAAMARSKREIPHYYLSTTIDMTAALAWLRVENEKRSLRDRLLAAVLTIKAVALALRDVPELNGFWSDGRFHAGTGIHVGTAISLRGGGLVAPALHDADRLDLGTLMRKLQDLVARARAGSLRSSELTDSTITITNLGDQGVETAFGIIYPPQVAIVGLGRTAERPWVSGGRVEPRPVMTATLAGDHRATDGHRGGMFLTTLERLLQAPETL